MVLLYDKLQILIKKAVSILEAKDAPIATLKKIEQDYQKYILEQKLNLKNINALNIEIVKLQNEVIKIKNEVLTTNSNGETKIKSFTEVQLKFNLGIWETLSGGNSYVVGKRPGISYSNRIKGVPTSYVPNDIFYDYYPDNNNNLGNTQNLASDIGWFNRYFQCGVNTFMNSINELLYNNNIMLNLKPYDLSVKHGNSSQQSVLDSNKLFSFDPSTNTLTATLQVEDNSNEIIIKDQLITDITNSGKDLEQSVNQSQDNLINQSNEINNFVQLTKTTKDFNKVHDLLIKQLEEYKEANKKIVQLKEAIKSQSTNKNQFRFYYLSITTIQRMFKNVRDKITNTQEKLQLLKDDMDINKLEPSWAEVIAKTTDDISLINTTNSDITKKLLLVENYNTYMHEYEDQYDLNLTSYINQIKVLRTSTILVKTIKEIKVVKKSYEDKVSEINKRFKQEEKPTKINWHGYHIGGLFNFDYGTDLDYLISLTDEASTIMLNSGIDKSPDYLKLMDIITNFSTLKTSFENKIFGAAKVTSEVAPSKTIEQQIKDSLQDIVIKEIAFDYLTEATELNTLKTDGGIYEKNNSKINIGAICLTLSGVIVLLAILLIFKIRFNKKNNK